MRKINEKKARELYGGMETVKPKHAPRPIDPPKQYNTSTSFIHVTGHSRGK